MEHQRNFSRKNNNLPQLLDKSPLAQICPLSFNPLYVLYFFQNKVFCLCGKGRKVDTHRTSRLQDSSSPQLLMMDGFHLLPSLFTANLCFPVLAGSWPSLNFPSHPDTGGLLLTRVLDMEVQRGLTSHTSHGFAVSPR